MTGAVLRPVTLIELIKYGLEFLPDDLTLRYFQDPVADGIQHADVLVSIVQLYPVAISETVLCRYHFNAVPGDIQGSEIAGQGCLLERQLADIISM